MAAVTLHNDFGAQEEEICRHFPPFPFYLPCSNGGGCYDLSVFNTNPKPALSLSSFTLTKRLFSSASLSAARVVSSANLRLLTFPSPILILWAETPLMFPIFFPKPSSDNHFAFLFFFFFGVVLFTASCSILLTSVHSSSGTLLARSSPLNLFVTSTVNSYRI